MATERSTSNHDEIRKWAEAHNALPAEFASTSHDGEPRILGFILPAQPPGDLEKVSWEQFFAVFDMTGLALVYRQGDGSNFYEIVNNRPKSSPGQQRYV